MAGYGSDQDFTEWLTSNGLSITITPPITLAVLRQRGSDYIDSLYGNCFFGQPAGGSEQERAWPRTGAVTPKGTIPDNVIPLKVIIASYQAAFIEYGAPGSLSVMTNPSKRIRRQKVDGAVEREFFDGGADVTSAAPYSTFIDGILKPYVDQVCMGRVEPYAGLFIAAVGSDNG